MSRNASPTEAQITAMAKLPDDGPIQMLNLIRLRDKAVYKDGTDATGAQAYATYGRKSGPIFARLGGRIVWSGAPKLVLIGPEDERWDVAFIAEYPSASAFFALINDPEYKANVHHRQAAVEDSRLIRLAPDMGASRV